MNKKVLFLIIFISSFLCLSNVKAYDDGNYYIAHKWVKNNSSTGNNDFYIGFFKNKPTVRNEVISDTENIVYYRFDSYDKMKQALETENFSQATSRTTNNNSMKLNTDKYYMYYSNFDLYDENNSLYFEKREYSPRPVSSGDDIEGKVINLDFENLDNYMSKNKERLDNLDEYWQNQMPYTDSQNRTFNNYAIVFRSYNIMGGFKRLERYDVFLYNSDDLYLKSYYRRDYWSSIKITPFKEGRFSDDDCTIIGYENDDIDNLNVTEEINTIGGWTDELTYYGKFNYNKINFPVNYFSEFFEGRFSTDVNFEYVYSTNSDFKITKDQYSVNFKYNGEVLHDDEEIETVKSYEEYNNLKLKKTFNSGTNAGAMGKIVWDINAYGDVKAMDGILPFKLQYGGNDFKVKNIPKFSSYKIYGSNNFESGWTDLTDDERFYFDDFVYQKYAEEGIMTETTMTSTLHIPDDMCVYENIKVEFYFDNTNNFYLYAFDDLSTNFNEGWSDVEYYFNDYIYYEFPKNTRYGFISSKTIDNIKGKIYFPYNFSNNTEALLGAYIYDYKKNDVDFAINEKSFKDNSYYSYFEFDYKLSEGKILFLERKTNTNETPYFYLHKDYFVEFRNNTTFDIQTPNGWVNINTEKIKNPYSKVDLEENNEDNGIFAFVSNHIYKKLPIIKQLGDIYNSFKYVEGEDSPPTFTFDMSFMRGGNLTFRFDFFDRYRDMFFNFIKIFFSIYTVLAIVNEVRHIIGGGN